MVAAKATAEEQLLRMIEGSATPPPSSKRPVRRISWPALAESLRRATQTVRYWLTRPTGGKAPADPFLWQLQLTGRIAWIVLAGLGLYVVADMWLLQPTPPRLTAMPSAAPGGQPEALPAPHATVDPLEEHAAEYRETLAARNPFRLTAERIIDTATGHTARSKLLELTAPLIVVGINRGRVPEALIEHSEEKRTYFVKVGDQINGITVKSIDQQGVTVTYEGEETTLQ